MIFLCGLKLQLYAEKVDVRKKLLVSKKKIEGNHAFLRDNYASISERMLYIALYFKAF